MKDFGRFGYASLILFLPTSNFCPLQKYFSDSGIPCLLVGTKADQEPAAQNYFLQPEDFCSKYNLPALQFYSAERPQPISRDIFIKLATMASYP
jgi:Ras family protein T1